MVPMSPNASPAKDCPRMTVNTPTVAGHDRDERPHAERDVDRFALEEARREDRG